jgi:ribulose-phosphate 3-epimerase
VTATARQAGPGPKLSVGVLTADLSRLSEELTLLRGTGAWAHLDIMDGRFCPALTFGAPLVAAVASCGVPVDAHLMVEEPRRFLPEVVDAGASVVTVHAEATRHLHRTLQELTDLTAGRPGFVRGLALNPGTPVQVLEPVVELIDLVLILAVNPGWSGQRPAPATARRIAAARELLSSAGRDVAVGVDGGVTLGNAVEVASWRPDVVVSGSAVYDGRDAAGNLATLTAALAEQHRQHQPAAP